MVSKKLLILASVASCALSIGAQAQTPVAFIGGSTLYNWANSGIFGGSAAYKWESYGFKLNSPPGPCHETDEALSALQGIIQGGQKPVISLLVGADDADGTSDSNPIALQLQSFAGCFDTLVSTAVHAKLKVVVGTNPFAHINNVDPYNKFIFAYAAAKGIPVIDYQTLLKRANENFEGTEYEIIGPDGDSITNKGYAIMNGLANEVISHDIGGVTLKSGYLGNEALPAVQNGDTPVPQQEVNTVYAGTMMHWYAYGQYSDGSTAEIDNGNVLHEYGTWTSSNPEVISIDPYGNAWALAPGTANIHFTTLSGVTINEWVMYVDKFDNSSL